MYLQPEDIPFYRGFGRIFKEFRKLGVHLLPEIPFKNGRIVSLSDHYIFGAFIQNLKGNRFHIRHIFTQVFFLPKKPLFCFSQLWIFIFKYLIICQYLCVLFFVLFCFSHLITSAGGCQCGAIIVACCQPNGLG